MADASTSSAPSQVEPQEKHVSSGLYYAVLVPLLAVFTALVLGGILILITDSTVTSAWRNVFQDPMAALSATWHSISTAYGALLSGSLGLVEIWKAAGVALRGGGTEDLAVALVPLSESLTTSVPFIFAGLAVAIGFQGGLFNIGAEGQILVGALCSVYVGYSITGLPWWRAKANSLTALHNCVRAWSIRPDMLPLQSSKMAI